VNLPRTWRWAGIAALCLAGIVPIVTSALRGEKTRGCALDGMQIDSSQRVRVLDAEGRSHFFCSLSCAELWVSASRTAPERIYVTDENTGEEIDASCAYYVRSEIVSHAPTKDRRHAFARKEAAESHADSFRGRLLTGDDRPFLSSNRNQS